MYKLKTIETFDDVQDYDIFTDIVFDNFHHLNNVPHLHHTKAEIKKVLMSKKFLGLFVFNSESKIIGYLIGEFMTLNDGRKIYYVSYFYVVTKYRKLGIGSHLINAIINKCKLREIPTIVLTCDSENDNIYNYYLTKGFMPDSKLRTHGKYEIMSLII
jgi:ribosomal protein S18 acetylase RimI-like enzyme